MSAVIGMIAAFGLTVSLGLTFWQGFWLIILAYALAPASNS